MVKGDEEGKKSRKRILIDPESVYGIGYLQWTGLMVYHRISCQSSVLLKKKNFQRVSETEVAFCLILPGKLIQRNR